MLHGYVMCIAGKRSLFVSSASKHAREHTHMHTQTGYSFPCALKSWMVLLSVYVTLSLLVNALEMLYSN